MNELPSARAIADWLTGIECRALGAEDLLARLVERLARAGVPLWRVVTSLPTKHPEVFVRDLRWTAERGCTVELQPHALLVSDRYADSPVDLLRRGVESSIRRRLRGPDADHGFPVCRELAAMGGTDYLACAVRFGDGQQSFVSWATRAESGFADRDVALLTGLTDLLALRFELESARFTTRSLLEVYLGHNAASRVLAGAFRRGEGETIRAAIWFCDMRGFTTLSDRAPAAEVVATLDRFFERVATPIRAHRGEILKLIGDAVLAIFSGDNPPEVCQRALDAARGSLDGVDELNRERGTSIGLGVALHWGDVMYGNIGAHDRLDFTAIGAAVNEVCRVEALCKTLAPLLATESFVTAHGGACFEPLGEHPLRGVSVPPALFTVRQV
jgi:adenylate cyclase